MVSRVRAVPWVVVLALVAGLVGPGCKKDVGVQRLAQAEARYEALLKEGIGPRHPRFDEVRSLLREVPEASKAHAQAQAMRKTLDAGGGIPERPLAVPGREAPSRCEPLAQALGTAEGEARERILAELRKCREEEERKKAHDHPEGEHGHEH